MLVFVAIAEATSFKTVAENLTPVLHKEKIPESSIIEQLKIIVHRLERAADRYGERLIFPRDVTKHSHTSNKKVIHMYKLLKIVRKNLLKLATDKFFCVFWFCT